MAKATIITTISLLLFYILATLALQIIFDTEGALDLTGIIVGLKNVFGGNMFGDILVNVLGIIFIFTMFVETMGWVSGANSGIQESAENNEVPKIFSWTNKRGMPFKSTILLGIIGTIELLAFTSINQIVSPEVIGGGDLFWSLFAASSNILFLAYFLMFFAYIKAKFTDQLNKYGGYSNQKWLGIVLAFIALIVLAITWFLLIWAPGYDLITQTLPILISIIIAIIIGEICFIFANKKYKNSLEVSTDKNFKKEGN